jgi:hypothetical protein
VNTIEKVLSLYNSLLIEYEMPISDNIIERDQKIANIMEVLFYELRDLRIAVANLSNKLLK